MNYIIGIMFAAGAWILVFDLMPNITTRQKVAFHLMFIPIVMAISEVLGQ